MGSGSVLDLFMNKIIFLLALAPLATSAQDTLTPPQQAIVEIVDAVAGMNCYWFLTCIAAAGDEDGLKISSATYNHYASDLESSRRLLGKVFKDQTPKSDDGMIKN